MSLSDRIESTAERWSTKWKDRLRGWMGSWLLGGLNSFLAANESEAIDLVRQQLGVIRDDPDTPEDIKTVIDKLTAGTQPIPVVILIALGIILMIPTITAISQPLGKILTYKQERLFQSYRIDPGVFINLLRRFPGKWDQLVTDLKDLGITDNRIEALKDATLFYPSAQDLVTWLAREVFEPDAREKYGLDDEADLIDFSAFEKAAVSKEQALNYWRAHWQHPSFMQMMELLHRGLLTRERGAPSEPATPQEWEARDAAGIKEMYEWYRLVEIPPHWRDLLTESLWNVPTRVDVRRWWDMRVISEQELYSIYHRQGYHGKDLENYVNWTKVYTDFPSLIARWQKGWITLDDIRSWWQGLNLPPERLEEFIQEKIKPESPARVEELAALTKSEIYKGVKQGKITREEGIELLVDLGKNKIEAEYLLDINVPPDETDEKVEERKLSKADIRSALAAGIITETEARSKLAKLRYSTSNIDLLIKLFNAANNPPKEEKQKQASKADIVEGVKKGVITPEEGYTMLTDIGFSPGASNFILTVRVEESPFSPINYIEFKKLTQEWRIATGKEGRPMPEELQQLGQQLVELTNQVELLEQALKDQEAQVVDEDALSAEERAKLDERRVELNRARAELARVQTDYNTKLAEWRQGG